MKNEKFLSHYLYLITFLKFLQHNIESVEMMLLFRGLQNAVLLIVYPAGWYNIDKMWS